MRTSPLEYRLAEAVHTAVHTLLVRIVAVVAGSIGSAAWVASECPNPVVVTASLQALLYFFCSDEHSIQRWRRVGDLRLRNTLQSRCPCGRRSMSGSRLRYLCLCSVPVYFVRYCSLFLLHLQKTYIVASASASAWCAV